MPCTQSLRQKLSIHLNLSPQNDQRHIKAAIKDLEEQETLLTFDIGQFISPHASLKRDGVELCTWKAQATTRLDQAKLKEELPDIHKKYCKTTTTRVLRLKKGT
jgi:predicted phage-related endonuclease